MAQVRGGHAFAMFTAAWVAYDILAAEDEQLTDAARRLHRRHPIGWTVAVLATTAHLLDWYRKAGVPGLDPYTRVALAARRTARR
ncbi:DUF7427 family protein [Nocardia concava]|uniref:DUF7427 family protein n=1 Tax=Nocardia concava TaxID=257281 RepID=UPI0002D7CB59|nr:hypothetical protein [Nocardia concava]